MAEPSPAEPSPASPRPAEPSPTEPAGASGDSTPEAAAGAARGRRELGTALVVLAAGAVLALTSSGRTWLHVSQAGALPPVAVDVTGRTITGAAVGVGLLGLAGVAAIAATRQTGRIVVGALLTVLALLLGAEVVRVMVARPVPPTVPVLPVGTGGPVATSVTAWPVLAIVGAVLVAVAGALVAVRGRRWAALSRAYSAPAAAAEASSAAPERDEWEALDAGEDPTA